MSIDCNSYRQCLSTGIISDNVLSTGILTDNVYRLVVLKTRLLQYGFSIQYRLVQYLSILYITLYNNLLVLLCISEFKDFIFLCNKVLFSIWITSVISIITTSTTTFLLASCPLLSLFITVSSSTVSLWPSAISLSLSSP